MFVPYDVPQSGFHDCTPMVSRDVFLCLRVFFQAGSWIWRLGGMVVRWGSKNVSGGSVCLGQEAMGVRGFPLVTLEATDGHC